MDGLPPIHSLTWGECLDHGPEGQPFGLWGVAPGRDVKFTILTTVGAHGRRVNYIRNTV